MPPCRSPFAATIATRRHRPPPPHEDPKPPDDASPSPHTPPNLLDLLPNAHRVRRELRCELLPLSPHFPLLLSSQTVAQSPAGRRARHGPLAMNGYARSCLHVRLGCLKRALATHLACSRLGQPAHCPCPTAALTSLAPRRSTALAAATLSESTGRAAPTSLR